MTKITLAIVAILAVYQAIAIKLAEWMTSDCSAVVQTGLELLCK